MPMSLIVCFKVSWQPFHRFSRSEERDPTQQLDAKLNHPPKLQIKSQRCLFRPQVVQEYERAVIFRLGRLMKGGAKGPGECRC